MIARRLKRATRFPNPKFTDKEEQQLQQAEAFSTKATIFELGVGEYLKTHMPCGSETEIATNVLLESVRLRKDANLIHQSVGRHGRKGRAARSKK